MPSFNLSVIKPIAGTKGKVMFTTTVHANSVSDAVKLVRNQVEGSGWIVLQSSQVEQDPRDTTLTAAIRSAYEKASA